MSVNVKLLHLLHLKKNMVTYIWKKKTWSLTSEKKNMITYIWKKTWSLTSEKKTWSLTFEKKHDHLHLKKTWSLAFALCLCVTEYPRCSVTVSIFLTLNPNEENYLVDLNYLHDWESRFAMHWCVKEYLEYLKKPEWFWRKTVLTVLS